MLTTAQRAMTPAPSNIQKTQRNWRLTKKCSDLLRTLSSNRGIPEAAMIEILVREAWEREQENPPKRGMK